MVGLSYLYQTLEPLINRVWLHPDNYEVLTSGPPENTRHRLSSDTRFVVCVCVCVCVTVYQQIENSLITKKDLKRNLEKLTVTVQLFIDTIIESIRHCPPYAPLP